MPDILLSEAEQDVLSRCSGMAVKAYLRLRARMDLASGVVGAKSAISYQALREWAEEAIERGAGEQVVQPSLKQMRTAVEQLCRRGLLLRLGGERLVFKCPLAKRASARPDQTGQSEGRAKEAEQGTEQGRVAEGRNASAGAGFAGYAQPEHGTEPGRVRAGGSGPNRAHIGDRGLKPSPSQAASTAEPGARARRPLAAGGLQHAVAEAVADEPGGVEAIGAWLREAGVVVGDQHWPLIAGWVAQGVPDADLRQAVAAAQVQREADADPAPVNAGFVHAKLQSVLRPARTSEPAWWATYEAMDAKARELGIAPARPGEEAEAFKARIRAALRRPAA